MQDESTIGLPCPTGVFQGARHVVSVKVKTLSKGWPELVPEILHLVERAL